MSNQDPLEEVKLLKKAIARNLPTGLELETMAIVPPDDDDPDGSPMIECAFRITVDALMTDSEREQSSFDDQFAAIMGGVDLGVEDPDKQEAEEKSQSTIDELSRQLEDWDKDL